MKLSTTFIILGIVSVIASAGNGLVGAAARYKMVELGNEEALANTVKQRHMEGDMQHDALWGATMGMLVSLQTGSQEGVQQYAKEAREDLAEFEKNVADNLQETGLPANIRETLTQVQGNIKPYGELAVQITSMSDFNGAAAQLPALRERFKTLEVLQEQANEAIAAWQASLHVQFDSVKTMMLWVGTAISVVAVIIALILQAFVQLGVFRRLREMIRSMHQIAEGRTETAIPHLEYKNEIGEMARTLQIFKENALQVQKMATDREAQQQQSSDQQKATMNKLANDFEANVKNVVDMVASAATEMDATAKHVADIAEGSKHKLAGLTGEVGQATQNVQTVASAATQLSSAINEINRQVARATSITGTAVGEAQRADGTVQELVQAASKIGEVVAMINSIAEQINLLALNATIEAARAGDAGKGFAVVASEVKNLAGQTTKATEEITAYITSIQTTTNSTVDVIKTIGGSIREINEISTAIAAAVEEQGAATKDIAQNVQQAANSTEVVSREASQVTTSANETGEAASQMTAATSELSRQAETLRNEVDKFLVGVRAG